jgi:hypothetical protein
VSRHKARNSLHLYLRIAIANPGMDGRGRGPLRTDLDGRGRPSRHDLSPRNLTALQLRQHNSFLRLILSLAILVADLANFVRLEEENLT